MAKEEEKEKEEKYENIIKEGRGERNGDERLRMAHKK